MKNAMKRIMSILLVALLLVSALPLAASATELPAGFIAVDSSVTPSQESTGNEQTQEQTQTQAQTIIQSNESVALTQSGEGDKTAAKEIKVQFVCAGKSDLNKNVTIPLASIKAIDAFNNYYEFEDVTTFDNVTITGIGSQNGDFVLTNEITAEIYINVTYVPKVKASFMYGGRMSKVAWFHLPNKTYSNIATAFAMAQQRIDIAKELGLEGVVISYKAGMAHYEESDGKMGRTLTEDRVNPGDHIIFELSSGAISAGPSVILPGGTLDGSNGNNNGNNSGSNNSGNNSGSNNGNNNGTNNGGNSYNNTYVSNGDLYLGYNSANANKDPYPVMLYVYTKNSGNGITFSADFNISGMASDDKTSVNEIYNYLKNYYNATNSDGIRLDGIYEYTYNFNSSWAQNVGRYDEIFNLNSARKDGRVELAVVLSNAKLKSASVADSSNPKTGDTIFVPVAVLGASATALAAVMYFYNKKRLAQ